MSSCTALASPSTDGGNVGLPPLLDGTVGSRRQLNQRVQRYLHPGRLFLRAAHEISVDAAKHGLVSDNEDVLATLQLHNDGLEADDDVAVGLATQVAVVVLVCISALEVLGVTLFNLGVGQSVTDTRVELIEGLPGELLVRQEAGSLDCSLEGGSPDGELGIACGVLDELRQLLSIELTAF